MRKTDLGRLSTLLLLGAISCQTAPPNIPVCVELSMDKAACIYTISGQKFDITNDQKFGDQTWWDQRHSMIMMPASSYAKLKTYIITQCKKTKMCDKEISSWNRTLESIDEALEMKK